jgi:hypothetical protein
VTVLRVASGLIGVALLGWAIGLFAKSPGDVPSGAFYGIAALLLVGGVIFLVVAVLRRPR